MIEIRIIALIMLALICLNTFVFKWRWATYVLGLLSTFALMIPVAWSHYQTWPVSLSDNLIVGLVFIQSAYLTFFFSSKDSWKTAVLVQPVLLVLSIFALMLWPGRTLIMLESNWLFAHILGALAAFGVLGYSAICAAAYLYKTGKIKSHGNTFISKNLPSVATLERLEFSALMMGQTFLLISIVAGQWYYYNLTGDMFPITHKFIFTLLAFILVLVLISMRLILGTRGRVASRIVLVAYLLVSIGFIGSKVVIEFLQ